MGLENFLFLSGNGSDSVALLLVSVTLLDFTRGEVSSCPADLPRKEIPLSMATNSCKFLS